MKKDQNDIYYISGESIEQILTSPQIEGFKSRGLEVIYMTDPIDEFWLPSMNEYEGKPFKSITKGLLIYQNLIFKRTKTVKVKNLLQKKILII